MLAERWRVHHNSIRPHSSLAYRPPAPEIWVAKGLGCGEVETATRFPLLHTSGCDEILFSSLRYTNNPTGAKDRADQNDLDGTHVAQYPACVTVGRYVLKCQ